MLIEATKWANDAIGVAKKNEVLHYLHTSTMVLSAIYYALGEKKRAKSLIQGTTALLKKNRLMRDYYIQRLLSSNKGIVIPEKYKGLSSIKLILLIKRANQTRRIRDYNCALQFAVQKGLRGVFHRFCIFNSEIILKLMEKGKPTGLPKAILSLPIFNKQLPAFQVKFLGQVKIFKAEKNLNIKLRPQDEAFLIHL